MVRQPTRWNRAVTALLGLLLLVRVPWGAGGLLENLSQNLGGAGADTNIWDTAAAGNVLGFLSAAAFSALLFVLIVWVFVPLGQVVGRQMNLTPKPLTAYSLNLAASLAGILAFLAVSRLMLPPWVWLGVVLLGFALLQRNRERRILLGSLLIPLMLLLHEPSDHDHYSIWTPYQQIDFTRIYAANGEMAKGLVQVNHIGYQFIVNLTDDFLGRHPKMLTEAIDENPYNVPFRFAAAAPSVMIVGAGTGNDVAAALRHGSSSGRRGGDRSGILEIGKKEHPRAPV